MLVVPATLFFVIQIKLKLRRIFQRAALDQNEISILRGMLSSLAPAHPERGRAR